MCMSFIRGATGLAPVEEGKRPNWAEGGAGCRLVLTGLSNPAESLEQGQPFMVSSTGVPAGCPGKGPSREG